MVRINANLLPAPGRGNQDLLKQGLQALTNTKENVLEEIERSPTQTKPKASAWLRQQAQAFQQQSEEKTEGASQMGSTGPVKMETGKSSSWLQYQANLAKCGDPKYEKAARIVQEQRFLADQEQKVKNAKDTLDRLREDFDKAVIARQEAEKELSAGTLYGLTVDEFRNKYTETMLAIRDIGDARDQAEREYKAMEDELTFNRSMIQFFGLTDKDQEQIAKYADWYVDGKLSSGSIPNALSAKEYLRNQGYSDQDIGRLAESFSRYRNSEDAQQRIQSAKEFANEHQVLGTVASWGSQLVGSVTGAVEAGKQSLKGALGQSNYLTADPNAAGFAPGTWAGAVQGQVAQNILGDDDDPVWRQTLGKIGSYGYQAMNSAVNSGLTIAAGALTGGGSTVSSALFFMSAGQSEFQQKSAAGYSMDEAFLSGVVSGGLELLTEKYSVDKLLSMNKPSNWKQLLKNAATQGLVEVTEEEANFVGGLLADAMIHGADNTINRRVRELMDTEKLSREDAKKQAFQEVMQQAADTAITSFLSGGMMAGVTGGKQLVQDAANASNTQKKQLQDLVNKNALADTEKIKELIESGLKSDPSSGNYQLAEKLKEKLESGNKLSNQELSQLMDTYSQGAQGNPIKGAEVGGQIEQSDQLPPKLDQSQADTGLKLPTVESVARNDQSNSQLPGLELPSVENGVPAERGQTEVKGLELPKVQGLSTDGASTQEVNASPELKQQVQRLSAATGRKIVLYSGDPSEQGYWDGSAIHVNVKGADPFAQTVGHELTHSVETSDFYKDLSSLVLEQIELSGGDLTQLRQEKADLYARRGHTLNSVADIDRELVAEYVSKHLLTDEASILAVARKKPTLARRILSWLGGILKKLTGQGGHVVSHQERQFLSNAMELYRKALEDTRGSFTEQTAAVDAPRESADTYAGANADFEDMAASDMRTWADQAYQRGDIDRETYNNILDAIEEQEFGDAGFVPEQKRDYDRKQHSIRDTALDRHTVAADLRDILNRGGDVSELRRYVEQMEQSTQGTYQNGRAAEQNTKNAYQTTSEAEQILRSAQEQGISVDEYLRQNWEQYEYDGELNEDARQALDLERRSTDSRVQKNTARSGVQYSFTERTAQSEISARYRQTVDDVLAGTHTDNSAVLLGYTPEIYQEMGMPSLPFVIGVGHIYSTAKTEAEAIAENRYSKKTNYHGLGEVAVKDLYKATQDPVMVIASKDVNPKSTPLRSTHSIVAIVDVGLNGKHLLLPVEITAKRTVNGEEMDVNVLSSAYNKKISELVREAVALENIGEVGVYYIKKGATLPADSGVQFPIHLSKKIASGGIIHKFSEKVNLNISDVTQSRQFKRWFGDWQNHPENASKVVNTDGTPMVVYHGTNAQFNIFRSQSGEYWFSENEDYAESMMEERGGGEVKAVYLNMRNPYRAKLPPGQFSDPGYEAKILRDARAAHHDGVIIENDTTNPLEAETFYVVFSPEQIKSATDNIGTFDGRNPDIRYSLSDDVQVIDGEENTHEETLDKGASGMEIRKALPAKARDYLKRTERNLLNGICKSLSVPYYARREQLQEIVTALSNEYLQEGHISQETTDRLFETAYNAGIVVDSEFYSQYKHIKDHLRKTPVTISSQDQSNIADYADFKKRAFNTLKIVKEGGLPVDVAYDELRSMAPELFPDHITHPADQLQHMYDVARNIVSVSYTLNQYYNGDRGAFRKDAKHEFEAAIDNVISELKTVRRYANDKAKEKDVIPVTADEAMEVYQELKEARRLYERVAAKNLLTAHDEAIVGDLLKGKATLENLDPGTDNISGITAVYNAKVEYERLCRIIRDYKQNISKKLRERADELLETTNNWKDKSLGLAYMRETMRRNIQDIVPDRQLAAEILKEYFEPVAVAEAASNRFKNKYRDWVRSLNLSTKVRKGDTVSEAHAVQLLGEAMDNIAVIENARGRLKHRDGKTRSEWQAVITDLWASSPSLNKSKIEGAVKEFRKIYDELFRRMNQIRVENGYEPVNYRKGYFPHFQPGGDGILGNFGKVLGISTEVTALPTTINGLTHTFKPGIQWMGNAQERLGFNTAYDAVEGFDKYIEGVAGVIHHTQNIQKLRALASQIRYRTTDDGIRKQVDEVLADDRLTENEKKAQIESIYEKGRFTLSNFVTELDEYTNLLANKKSKLDRTVEAMFGRRSYTLMKWLEGQVGANMIAGNLSSAVTNLIPLQQAAAQIGNRNVLRGMLSTLQAVKADDGIVNMSSFLTNRRGSDPLVKGWREKGSAVLGKPMELIDSFVSDSIVRAAYLRNLQQGLSEAEAMHQADIFAAGVIADRSKGAMPTLFQSTNPVFKLFTQFQLEVNNQFSEVFKDLPRSVGNKAGWALAALLLKYFLGAWLFNDFYEKVFGRRPALDPIGLINDSVGDFTGYEIPNILDLVGGVVTGDMPSWKTEKPGTNEALKNLGSNVLGELPFAAALNAVGLENDGGRIPVSSAIPDIPALIDALSAEGWDWKKRTKEVWDEASKPITYILPPFGGNQISKTWKGLEAYFKGGSYTYDKEGNEILQYPVYTDDPEDAFWSMVRSTIMGKSSLQEAQDWVNSGFNSLSAKETATYQDMLAAGVSDRDAYALVMALKNAKETDNKSKKELQRAILTAPSDESTGVAKAIAYYGMVAGDSDRELMDKLGDLGADPGASVYVAIGLDDTSNLKGLDLKKAQRDVISESALTDQEKAAVVEHLLGSDLLTEGGNPTQYAKFLWAYEQGFDVDDYLDIRADGVDVDDVYENIYAGMDMDAAMEAARAVADLEPVDGNDKVADVQRWRACVDFTSDTADQILALKGVMTDAQYAKVELANKFGVEPDAYVDYHEIRSRYDANGNGSYSQAEIKATIDTMDLSKKQKAALWQVVTGSKSAKSNPYNTQVGQQVLNARANAEEDSKKPLSFEEEVMRQIMENWSK